MADKYNPKYIDLKNIVFKHKIKLSRKMLGQCCLCPRKCGADRLAGQLGYCNAGNLSEVSHWQRHYGEEPPFSQNNGAGTIFFAHCNLQCVYCQNHQISQQQGCKNNISVNQLADIMLKLQQEQAENIDLVSPTHFVPMIIEAIYIARNKGLRIPIIYNTNGYDSEKTLELLEGIVDVYMPDLKYDSEDAGLIYSDVFNYVYYAKQAILLMYKQVGGFKLDQSGKAISGLFVRHLVLPNNIANSKQVLDFLRTEIGNDIGLSLMSQYAPCYRASNFKEINRVLNQQEYELIVEYAQELGFGKSWMQELKSSDVYFPDFEKPDVFDLNF
ncbi:MAG: radical SAM protein [Candidatus Omnitrophica bacterium]|nr:radical SAM protein [Candidatus Omnitrophota bacterium]